jgi:hypothetical protein
MIIKKGNFDLAAEFLHPVKPMQSPIAPVSCMIKSRNVFPKLKSELLTMIIFSYVDVHHRALDILKRLNSKGYDIYIKQRQFKHMFEVFLKSQIMCAKLKTFLDEEIFSQEISKSNSDAAIAMINIELYCDGNYPRGISILYLFDGQKSIQMNYIERTGEVFRKDSLALN